MAYQRNYASRLSGLGQLAPSQCTATTGCCADNSAPTISGCQDGSTPTCQSGYTFNGLQCSQTNYQIGNPFLPVGSVSSIIPGVANSYVYIAGAAFFGLLLLGVMKK